MWDKGSGTVGIDLWIKANPAPAPILRPYSAAHVECGFQSSVQCYLMV